MSKRRTRDDNVHTITSAQGPLGEDIERRARRYLAQMTVRTLCFLGAVLTWGRVPPAVSGALLVGAVVLPYVAVVLANAGRERTDSADSLLDPREITGPPHAPPVTAPTTVPPGAGAGAPAPPRAPTGAPASASSRASGASAPGRPPPSAGSAPSPGRDRTGRG